MKIIRYLLICLLAFSASLATAAVVLHGTRVIYPAGSKDASIVVANVEEHPVLVQAWLDRGDDPHLLDKNETPFVLTPPIFRLNPAKTQLLRIIHNQEPLPKDRESIFWLNVLEVPPSLEGSLHQNSLDLTFRTRIKMFFRPAELNGDLRKAVSGMNWKLSQVSDVVNVLVENTSPYYITLTEAVVTVNGEEYKTSADGKMVPPFDSLLLPLSDLKSTEGLNKVVYAFIDDIGATVSMESKLNK